MVLTTGLVIATGTNNGVLTTWIVHQRLARWAEPVSLTFHSALIKLNTDFPCVLPSKFRFIWLSSFREDFFRNRPI